MSPYREWIQKQNDFLKRGCINPKTILHGRDAILRVRAKLLIFNMVLKLWADVKYHVPTGFGFSPKASGFYPLGAKHWHRQKAVFYVFVLVTLTCQKDGCKPKGRFFCSLTYVIYGGIAFSIGWCLSPRGGFSRCAFPRGSLGACLASGRRVSAPPVGPLPRHAAPRW